MLSTTSEIALESVIDAYLLVNYYTAFDKNAYDPQCLISPEVVLSFIRETHSMEWAKLEFLRAVSEKTIAMLKERRAALISTAVTGKIDIREEFT